ncbi:MAG TPA: transcriptional regulator [Desulfotomaculum sp.]|nr:MAG: hypothetical protein JL56_14345 [Desulfotomaculum sp. BICA1-6]HBX24186.1 transcriptional regulator [Desulfotomaculum sp.]
MGNKVNKTSKGLFVLPEESREGYLIGTRCSNCNTVTFPRWVVCPDCLRDDTMEEIPLSRKGKLYSFSVNRVAPEGFEAPYITGRVELPEKIRIFSVITGCEPVDDALQIGMDMELVFEPLRKDEKGNDLVGYKFKPLRNN